MPFEGIGHAASVRGAQTPIYETVSVRHFVHPWFCCCSWYHSQFSSFTAAGSAPRLGDSPRWGASAFSEHSFGADQWRRRGAHRSWAFSFIGIAVVCGPALVRRGISCGGPRGSVLSAAGARVLLQPGVRIGVVGAVLTMLLVGVRRWGRTCPPASWTHAGRRRRAVGGVPGGGGAVAAGWRRTRRWTLRWWRTGAHVTAGRRLGGANGPLAPSAGFPLWDLYMSDRPVRPYVLSSARADIHYFVVDARMARNDASADGLLVHQR